MHALVLVFRMGLEPSAIFIETVADLSTAPEAVFAAACWPAHASVAVPELEATTSPDCLVYLTSALGFWCLVFGASKVSIITDQLSQSNGCYFVLWGGIEYVQRLDRESRDENIDKITKTSEKVQCGLARVCLCFYIMPNLLNIEEDYDTNTCNSIVIQMFNYIAYKKETFTT